MDATNSPAQQATGDSASSAAACGSDPFGSPDNPFDNDDPFGSSHGAGGGSNVGAALLSRDLPAEAATGDRQCYLKRTCEYIVDTYLTNGAAFQVTFADHQYKVKCASANGGKGYPLHEGMFDAFASEVYTQIQAGSWMRFRLSDQAQQLGRAQPHLLLTDEKRAKVVSVDEAEATSQAVPTTLRARLGRLAQMRPSGTSLAYLAAAFACGLLAMKLH